MVNSGEEEGQGLSLGPKDPRLLELADVLGVIPAVAEKLCAAQEHILRVLAFNHGFTITRFEMPLWHELLTDYLKDGELPDREKIEDLFPGVDVEKEWGGC